MITNLSQQDALGLALGIGVICTAAYLYGNHKIREARQMSGGQAYATSWQQAYTATSYPNPGYSS
jgi:hypothetical protein